MVRLTKGRKRGKHPSEFQKLWAKAERLKKRNARFQKRLDAIVDRVKSEVLAAEQEAARKQIPLLHNLLKLGQRKSLTKWQRYELHNWIQELLEPLLSIQALDPDLADDLARYDAFRTGIELDENASTPLTEQLQEQLSMEEDELTQQINEALHENIREEVERILDATFGPAPPKPQNGDTGGDDLFQDELNEEIERQYHAYHKQRDAARKQLMGEMLEDDDPFLGEDGEDDEDFFSQDFDAFDSESTVLNDTNSDMPVLSNSVFKRLFRSTAGQLHPDRESDPVQREKKHALMSQLLKARKEGDVMTIVEMYQQYVKDDASLSKADESQLIATLQAQIERLEDEQDEYCHQSPLHQIAYENFYFPSSKKTEQAFKQHLQHLRNTAAEAESLSLKIKTLKTLKPHLEQRYEEHSMISAFEEFERMFGPGF